MWRSMLGFRVHGPLLHWHSIFHKKRGILWDPFILYNVRVTAYGVILWHGWWCRRFMHVFLWYHYCNICSSRMEFFGTTLHTMLLYLLTEILNRCAAKTRVIHGGWLYDLCYGVVLCNREHYHWRRCVASWIPLVYIRELFTCLFKF